jgi:uncharacterized protein YbbC (DUF1343 family)
VRHCGRSLKKIVFVLLAALALPALGGCAAALPPPAPAPVREPVRLGIDNIDKHLGLFAGKRIGLITNATGISSNYESTIDILKAKTNLVALYAPEHGIRGAVKAGDQIGYATDRKTGLPIYSLYGATKKPTPEMLADVDILVFDIQDVGARPYTYIYTMAYAMQAAKENGKTFVVLDRPNPVGGMVEGGLVKPGFESFIGMYPIPLRHGMTVGELARYFNAEFGIGCDLAVVPLTGWKRAMVWADTGLPWVMTSPNIPTPDSALVYSGTGIFGGTNVSEGVGTTRPFELVGAAWLNAEELADRMNAMGLPGVYFRPAYFSPRFGGNTGKTLGGVQIHITDPHAYQAVRVGITLLYTIQELGGENFAFGYGRSGTPYIDLTTGDASLRLGIYTLEDLLAAWAREAFEFKEKAKQYYLYQ